MPYDKNRQDAWAVAAQQGDSAAFEELYGSCIKAGMKLLDEIFASSAYARASELFDDVESLAGIALYRGSRKYNIARGHFLPYYMACCYNEARMAFRSLKKFESTTTSLEEILFTDKSGKRLQLIEVLGDVTQQTAFECAEVFVDLRNIMSALTPLEREVFRRCNSGTIQAEIARVMGLSQSYVSRIYRRTRKKLQQWLLGEGSGG